MSSTNRGSDRGTAAHPNDLFQTPPEALIPLLNSGVVKLDGIIWECSAGRGAMVRTLVDHGVNPGRICVSDLAGVSPADFPDGIASVNGGRHDLASLGEERMFRDWYGEIFDLTVITNPAYRVPDASQMCGLEGDELAWKIPKARNTKDADGSILRWRDGVAMTFIAAHNASARQIVLGPIRLPWWHGARKTRGQLRRWILKHYDVTLMTLGWRPRFLNVNGEPAGSGSDSCEYGYLVADRRARPRNCLAGVGALSIEMEA